MTFEDHKFLRLARLPFRHPGRNLEQIIPDRNRIQKYGELGQEAPRPIEFGVPEMLEMFDAFEKGMIVEAEVIRRFEEISPLGDEHSDN